MTILEDIQAKYRIIFQESSRRVTCSVGGSLYNVLKNAIPESDLSLTPGSVDS